MGCKRFIFYPLSICNTFFVSDTLYATIFLKRRSGGALVKRITYHLREIWYALRYFREVDPVLLANPCDCPWREHLCGGLHAETCQNVAVLVHPAVKCSVTHSGSICQFVFVCAFHGLLFWLQTTDNRFVRCLFRYKVTKNKRIMQENLCLSFQIFSQVFNATLECRNFVS